MKTKINCLVQTAFLGDLLLTVPLMAWIKKTHPEMPLALVCRRGLGASLKALGLVDLVFEINKGDRDSYKKIRAELESYEIENWICPHNSFRSGLLSWQIRARHKVGYKNWNTQFFFHEKINRDKRWPESLRLLQIWKDHNHELSRHLDSLKNSEDWIQKTNRQDLKSPPEWANPHTFLDHSRVEKLKSELQTLKKYPYQKHVVLFPGSVWATKMWKKEKFVELGKKLVQAGEKVLVMGGPDEAELGEWVRKEIPGAISLCGKSNILESLLILSEQKLVIGNDSSSSHMAALMGKAVVSFFGPTVLRFGYRPWATQTKVFEVEGLKCRPCGAHGPKVCPLKHHNCMNQLNVEVEQFKEYLS